MAGQVAEKDEIKLPGETDIDAALQRLNKLIVEESKMTVPEILDVMDEDNIERPLQLQIPSSPCMLKLLCR